MPESDQIYLLECFSTLTVAGKITVCLNFFYLPFLYFLMGLGGKTMRKTETLCDSLKVQVVICYLAHP